ncbi:conjugal transfer protein TraG N-terminal domain-containing protein [Endozoicomonas atrinae]|uniref:conjugal transfer protein TraG N-terminal domain-containing protein n=1 Tax=Endozoicomonas atrinae TaxID=1333660 RepID=UPI000824E5E2|nr:conjugal transfer protein TraG N-terminal domain-containing protein [Endozoicomonas atrinae]
MFEIFSIGDAAFLEQVMIGLALITDQLSFIQMAMLACLIGVALTAFDSIMNGGKSFNIHHSFLGVILFMMFFVPKVTVVIEDAYTGDLRPVDNVPIGPAAAGSLISSVGLGITDMFEFSYGIIAPGITQRAFLDSLQLLTESRRKLGSPPVYQALDAANGVGTDIRMSISNYVRECTAIKLQREQQNTSALSEENLLDAIKYDHNAYETMLYLAGGAQQFTCAKGYVELSKALSKIDEDTVMTAIGSMIGMNEIAAGVWPGGETPFDRMDNSFRALDMLGASATAAKDYTLAAVIEPIFYEALQGSYSDIQDTSAAIMVNQAIQQRNTQWATEQSLFMSTVRPLMAFFEAFVFGIAPIAAFIMLLGQKGIALAGKYLMLILFIQLWYPILSLTNLYIYMAAASEMGSYDLPNWTSLYGLQLGSQVIQTWIATGGMLAASTPMLAMMLLYGSAYTATSLAGRMSSADHVNERITSPDAVTPGGVMQDAPRFMHNDFSGTQSTGVPLANFAFGSQMSRNVSSSRQEAFESSGAWASTLARGFQSSDNEQHMRQASTSLNNSLQASNSQGATATKNALNSFFDKYDFSAKEQEAISSATVLSASATGGADLAGIANSVISSGGKIGSVMKAAANGDFGANKAPDKPVAGGPLMGRRKQAPEPEMEAPSGLPVDLKASASIQGNTSSKTDNLTSHGNSQGQDTSNSFQLSNQNQSSLQTGLVAQTSQNDQSNYSRLSQDTQSASFQNQYSEANKESQAYQEVAGLQTSIGSTHNMTEKDAAAMVIGRGHDDDLNTLFNQLASSGVINGKDLTDRYNENRALKGMGSDEAYTAAQMGILLDDSKFKNGADGAYMNTSSQVAAWATGRSYDMGSNINPYANQGVGADANPGYSVKDNVEEQVPQAGNIGRPETSYQPQAGGVPIDSNGLPQDIPQEHIDTVNSSHNAYMKQTHTAGKQMESQVAASERSEARQGLINHSNTDAALSDLKGFEGTQMWGSIEELNSHWDGVNDTVNPFKMGEKFIEGAQDLDRKLNTLSTEQRAEINQMAGQYARDSGQADADFANWVVEKVTGEPLSEGAYNWIAGAGEKGVEMFQYMAGNAMSFAADLTGDSSEWSSAAQGLDKEALGYLAATKAVAEPVGKQLDTYNRITEAYDEGVANSGTRGWEERGATAEANMFRAIAIGDSDDYEDARMGLREKYADRHPEGHPDAGKPIMTDGGDYQVSEENEKLIRGMTMEMESASLSGLKSGSEMPLTNRHILANSSAFDGK